MSLFGLFSGGGLVDVSNIYHKRRKKMQAIDRKFKISAFSIKSRKSYSQNNAILFLVKDALLPDLLDKYLELCREKGVDERQILGVSLLKDRVLRYQRENIKKVKLPDVAEGEEENRVCKSNG